MAHQVHTYTELRQQIHDDLRFQHPEWVKPNGESPMCDSYEARLIELLDALTQRGSKESFADNLSKAGWSLGWVSAVDSKGRTIWIADAHRDDGKRFVVYRRKTDSFSRA